jgi:phosphodiesterase/alkaline phosphatase D-like protein
MNHPVALLKRITWAALLVFLAGSVRITARASGNDVIFAWSGAATGTSLTVNAQLASDSEAVRLYLSEQPDLSSPHISDYFSASAANNRVVSIEIGELDPDTPYYYALEADGVLYSIMLGRSHTFPQGAASFTLAMAGDASTGSNHPVFQTILAHDPLFFLHLGDLHYDNIDQNIMDLYRQAYDAVLASPGQAALYRSIPLAYTWDDHDYGPNNSDSTSPGRTAARLTYQEYVPHYPLAAGSGDVPIYQAFEVGRVRFILTDTRSERTPDSAPDDASKTMLGAAQKAWLKQQLLAANGIYPVIVWVNSVPWIDAATAGGDTWGGFTTERQELADFIALNDIRGLFMLSADAHMLAIDNGSNSDYASGGGAGFPLMHAAALDRSGSIKGGPYSEGAYPGAGQFGLMTVTDYGGSVCVDWSGRDENDIEIVSWGSCVPAAPPDFAIYIPLAVR